jgi:predicted nucleic-acid-binding protein
MIGIDTNVLLYAYVNKADPSHTERSLRAIRDNAPVLVNTVVLSEFVWTCKYTFTMERSAIHKLLDEIINTAEFRFDRPEVVARAVAGYGSRMSDFADWLIGETNLAHGCSATLTFDKGAAKGAAFKSVPA